MQVPLQCLSTLELKIYLYIVHCRKIRAVSQSVIPVAQSCPTLCDPMDCSTPGFPVHHQLWELTQTHVHWVGYAIQPSHPLLSVLFHLQSLPASGSFPMSQLFASGGQSTRVSTSASVLSMTIQGWFPLELTGLISLLFKGHSRVFSSTTIPKHQFFASGGQSIGVSASTSVLPMNI